MMYASGTVPLKDIQFVFDPVAKTVKLVRFDVMVAVPGRFETYEEAHVACLRIVRAQYNEAYAHE